MSGARTEHAGKTRPATFSEKSRVIRLKMITEKEIGTGINHGRWTRVVEHVETGIRYRVHVKRGRRARGMYGVKGF